jgi:hypothetical protein
VKAVSAHVRNGQIVLDEALDLHEGAVVKVLVPDDPIEMRSEDLAELEAALEDSAGQFERGEFEDARAFAVRLAARS